MQNSSIAFYIEHLNLQGATCSLIEHEDAMVATVYRVTQPSGKQLILKISSRPNDHVREVYFLRHFAGKIPVPQIIQVAGPEEGIDGAILMECLPGALLKIGELTETLAHEIGRSLALIHQSRLLGYGDPIQGELSPDPRVYFTMKFEEGLDECQHHLPSNTIEQCRRYYESHLNLLASVDGPCVVHRDFRPGNLMVNQGKLQGVIDWAGARASFAEEDLCSMEHGEWLGCASRIHLLTGYASVRSLPAYDHLIPFLRMNRAVATIGFTLKRGTWTSSGSRIYRFNRHFLETLLKERD